jgi:hypothetical protein
MIQLLFLKIKEYCKFNRIDFYSKIEITNQLLIKHINKKYLTKTTPLLRLT